MTEPIRDLQRIGVAGAGTMGTGIAQLSASFGHITLLYDNSPQMLTTARDRIKASLQRRIKDGRITQEQGADQLARITFTQRLEDLKRCAFIIEAIIENLEGKTFLFSTLETIIADTAVLATNTSSLSVTSIAAACKRRDRVLGLHFFNPPTTLPLVELIKTDFTAQGAIDATRNLAASWGKTVVDAIDTPGFLVNRVARPFYGEALRILEEQVADVATIDWAMRAFGGFKMGPFQLIDLIGNDVNFGVTENLYQAFSHEPRYRPSLIQKRMIEAGYLGKKSGRGFYEYKDGEDAPVTIEKGSITPEMEELGNRICARVLCVLMNEAMFARFYAVASAEDIDLAVVKGLNYPKGLLRWADELGLHVILARLEELHDEYGEERYRPCPLLKRMVANGEKFFT